MENDKTDAEKRKEHKSNSWNVEIQRKKEKHKEVTKRWKGSESKTGVKEKETTAM